MIRLPFLDMARSDAFPPVEHALVKPDGLLAAGGDLSTPRLLAAYRRGIFPWYSEGEPILWWSPSRRTVFDTGAMHVPRRLARWLRRCDWDVRADTAFGAVIRACAGPRAGSHGSWITPDMLAAYESLHESGYAHSVEAWDGGRLVGGLYGVAVGRMFFGESMFSAATHGSKVALLGLCRTLAHWNHPLLDAQVASGHLFTLGAREMPRPQFCEAVATLAASEGVEGSWCGPFPPLRAAELAG